MNNILATILKKIISKKYAKIQNIEDLDFTVSAQVAHFRRVLEGSSNPKPPKTVKKTLDSVKMKKNSLISMKKS